MVKRTLTKPRWKYQLKLGDAVRQPLKLFFSSIPLDQYGDETRTTRVHSPHNGTGSCGYCYAS